MLDGAKQVGQVGDGQSRLTIAPRRGDGIVDTQGAVDDRELGVRAQVDEGHRGIVGRGGAPNSREAAASCREAAASGREAAA